jgi:hypothetical protein
MIKRNCIKVNQIAHLPVETNGSEMKGVTTFEAILLVMPALLENRLSCESGNMPCLPDVLWYMSEFIQPAGPPTPVCNVPKLMVMILNYVLRIQ